MGYTENEIINFSKAVESLKKYRRSDLVDEQGKDQLDLLYTDLLPNEFILKKSIIDNTTFLIGRKGTGKSTIFLKMEKEFRQKKTHLPCYIDVKTVYESSSAQVVDFEHLKGHLEPKILEKYFLERTFIQNILKKLKEELTKKSDTIYEKIVGKIVNTKASSVKEKIINLSKRIEDNAHLKEIELPVVKQSIISNNNNNENQATTLKSENGLESGIGLKKDEISFTLKDGSKMESSTSNKKLIGRSEQFTEIFLKIFQIKDVISEIKEILKELDIKHLVVLLDDLSEIDDNAIRTFIDTLVAPLNNWSEEFIKFKIAVYPNRIYYGKIDPGKVDSINLDFYNLYSEFDRNKMEDYAIDFTKRLVEKRINYFTNKTIDYFFDTSKTDAIEYYELLFQVSMNVPRIIGYILSYCHQNKIIFDKQITKKDIESAAEKYYTDKIEVFFNAITYSLLSLDEKITILQMSDLCKHIVEKLVDIKKRIENSEFKGQVYLQNSPFSSHFHIFIEYEKFLNSLELNHFISKYDELSNKDGKKVYIYCINYGLAIKNKILWGKPKGADYRKYFIERPFNFNKYIEDFINDSKKIQCTNCNKLFKLEELPFLEFSKFKCNNCGSDVKMESLADKISNKISLIDKSILLPKEELSIINELFNFGDTFKYAREIAEELDISSQSVSKKCKALKNKYELIETIKTDNYHQYRLTQKAKQLYFSNRQ